MALLGGLLISGSAMSLAGSSAPASGGEHLFSHFLDMRESITGRIPELHGLQVAAGIIISAACYHRLARLPASDLERRAQRLFHAESERLPAIWGPLSDEVEKRLFLKRDDLLALDGLLPQKWASVQSLCRQVHSPRHYVNQMRRTGFELTLGRLNLDEEEFLLAATASRAIRERITVLDIAAQAGVLEAAAGDALELMR
jgi:glycerol-1-phosphate dehydrogenase [NAD(P)+]